LLAKNANDDAGALSGRGVLGFFATKLAPTELWTYLFRIVRGTGGSSLPMMPTAHPALGTVAAQGLRW